MFKRALIFGVAISFFLCGLVLNSTATEVEKGPADILLKTTQVKKKKKSPSLFPHIKHQETVTCGECHHGGEPGKQTAYIEGMKIEKCESCHFKDSGMPTKADKKAKKAKYQLNDFKSAAHANCKSCHKKKKKEKPELKKTWKKCLPCHVKKK